MANSSVADGFEMSQPTEDHKIEFFTNQLENDMPVSKTFNYNGDKWKLETRNCAYCDHHVSVELNLVTKGSVNGGITARIRCEADPNQTCNEKVLANSGETMVANLGWEEFWNGDDLKFEVQLVPNYPKLSPSSLADDYLKWFKLEDFGDVVIVANDGKKLRCHRDILARRSDVFAGMFSSGMKEERENLVNIEDFDGEIVAQLLQFVYTDDCQVDKISANLWAAARQYQLERLKIHCESVLIANLSAKTIVKTYRLATFYRLDTLMARCVDYLDIHKSEMSMADLLVESFKLEVGNEGQMEQK